MSKNRRLAWSDPRSLLIHVVLFVLVIIHVWSSQGWGSLFRTAKVTVVVVDENNDPVEDAHVGIVFETNRGLGNLGVNSYPINGLTNSEGKRTEQHNNDSNYIHYGVEKDGYYFSNGEYRFRERKLGKWQPWNPERKLVMRKIMNPVPMYARDTGEPHNGILIPVVGQDVGFDLIEYDWLPPYGIGREADFIFHLDSKSIASRNYDFKLKIKFKEGNGIIKIKSDLSHGSEFALPRYAPDDGYEKSLDVYVRRSPDSPIERSENKKNHYFFRVRSVMKDGKVVSAMYGKILRDIWMHPLQDDKARFEFKYYLNPDGTRNLEYDPKRNLFGKLPPLERVRIK